MKHQIIWVVLGLLAGNPAYSADTVAISESTVKVTVAKRIVSMVVLYGDNGEIVKVQRNCVERTTIATTPPTVSERGYTETLDVKEVATWKVSVEQTNLLDFLVASDKAAAAFTAISRTPTITNTKP